MGSSFRLSRPPDVARRIEAVLPNLLAAPLGLGEAAVPLVAARLLCGDFEAVRELIAHPTPDAALPLIAARYHAWSGDLHLVLSIFDEVRRSLDLVETAGVALRSATWPELERLATDVGDAVLAARLLRRARAEPVVRAPPGVESPAHTMLAALDPLLDIEPDAHRGRLRIRPRTGPHDEIRLDELRFADGVVSLHAQRQGSTVVYRVAQEAGAMPFTVLLEPVVGGNVRGAEVDGRRAELDPRPHDDGVLVPVQLVLDEERSLTLQL